ncbi:hypothetical protein K4K54_008633 [Colletotrichum sp. SAR 10_86]|nr:hypothetical protein K4K54_008633 [Colletotrichum sp. SAR 10_86]
MAHNILITGASGYLGGTLLARWKEAGLSGYDKLFALVRTDAQAEAVKSYGAEPLSFSLKDEKAVRDAVVNNRITIVYYLIDALNSAGQMNFITALAEVKRLTGGEVHFLHTSGAKIFSSHAGAPTDRPLLDTDPDLYNIQKAQKAPIPIMQTAVDTNNIIIEEAAAQGVKAYIFAPCIVYNATLYLQLLRAILNGDNPGSGKNGYYLASAGSVAWDDLYAAMVKALFKRGIISTDEVMQADQKAVDIMAKARLALNFKGVDYKTEWLEYPDIAGRLEAAGLKGDPDQIRPFTCPTVQFPDGTYIMNSKKIIPRIEADYPEPPLYHDADLSQEALKHIAPVWDALAPVLLPVAPREVLNERSAEYFWRTRKEFLGMSLDEFEEKHGGEKAWEKAKKPIEDAAALLNKTEGPFFLGDTVSYADFLYVGVIAMAKRFNEENYRRIVEISPAFDKQYKACGPWLERNDH